MGNRKLYPLPVAMDITFLNPICWQVTFPPDQGIYCIWWAFFVPRVECWKSCYCHDHSDHLLTITTASGLASGQLRPAVCQSPYIFSLELIVVYVHSFHKYLLNSYYVLGNSHKIPERASKNIDVKIDSKLLSAITIRNCCQLGRKTNQTLIVPIRFLNGWVLYQEKRERQCL